MKAPTPADLLAAGFPHPVRQLAVCETHISLVVLTGEFAYKIKKSLRLDFIDSSTLERRRAMCEEELRLNRRLAPDLYLDVVPLVRRAGRLYFGGAGSPVEYAVRMRQFDPAQELPRLLGENRVTPPEFTELAATLADFHSNAAAPPPGPADPCTEAFIRIVRANLANIRRDATLIDAGALVDALSDWSEQELALRDARLRSREREGFIRECHGDLHSRNIVRWAGRLTPFDCIEFDPALRFIDVLSDIAFLVMDLIDRGRRDLGYTLLNAYLERTGDYTGADLLPCYLVYRALVRAKVDLIAATQRSDNEQLCERALRRLRTADAFSRGRTPTIIVMHGASGSGKSWLSEKLAPLAPAVRIRSDLERKRIAGLDPLSDRTSGVDTGLYTRKFGERTYTRLLACASACLQGGFNVIADAAFLDVKQRRAFAKLAAEHGARYLIVSCGADRDVLAARIMQRRRARNDPSDADLAILRRQLTRIRPFADDEEAFVMRVDTRDSNVVEQVLERAAGSAAETGA